MVGLVKDSQEAETGLGLTKPVEEAAPPQWFADQDDRHILAPKWGEDNELIQTWKRSRFLFELQVFYQPAGSEQAGPSGRKDKDQIKMILAMPDKMWFSVGFGTGMSKTDMIGWHAEG